MIIKMLLLTYALLTNRRTSAAFMMSSISCMSSKNSKKLKEILSHIINHDLSGLKGRFTDWRGRLLSLFNNKMEGYKMRAMMRLPKV
jgi:hypothetical protein